MDSPNIDPQTLSSLIDVKEIDTKQWQKIKALVPLGWLKLPRK